MGGRDIKQDMLYMARRMFGVTDGEDEEKEPPEGHGSG